MVGDLGRRTTPLAIPAVALFVAAVLCGGIAMLRKAPARRRVPVVVVCWSTVVAWIPLFVYMVRSGA